VSEVRVVLDIPHQYRAPQLPTEAEVAEVAMTVEVRVVLVAEEPEDKQVSGLAEALRAPRIPAEEVEVVNGITVAQLAQAALVDWESLSLQRPSELSLLQAGARIRPPTATIYGNLRRAARGQ